MVEGPFRLFEEGARKAYIFLTDSPDIEFDMELHVVTLAESLGAGFTIVPKKTQEHIKIYADTLEDAKLYRDIIAMPEYRVLDSVLTLWYPFHAFSPSVSGTIWDRDTKDRVMLTSTMNEVEHMRHLLSSGEKDKFQFDNFIRLYNRAQARKKRLNRQGVQPLSRQESLDLLDHAVTRTIKKSLHSKK